MMKSSVSLRQFIECEEGATAIEYAILASMIAAIIAGTVGSLGGTVNTAFSNVNTGIS